MDQEFIEQEKKRLQRIEKKENRLQMFNFMIVAALCCCGYLSAAVCVALFSVYSWIFYLNGKESHIVDESGRPSVAEGVKLMVKSWCWLIAILYVVWLFSPAKTV